ncbi:MAG: hypothetical protein LCH91_11225 [Bacteroidetes bacterium]|nr:hypothetical protein [Bacteroidota bacterium]
MKLMQRYRRIIISALITILFFACESNKKNSNKISILSNSISLEVPKNWEILHDSLGFADDILLDKTYIGIDDKNGVFARLVQLKFKIPLSKLLEGEEQNLKEKNPFATIVSKSLNTDNNSFQIEYTYQNKSYYGVFVVHLVKNKKVELNFNLEDNHTNKIITRNIIESVSINSNN